MAGRGVGDRGKHRLDARPALAPDAVFVEVAGDVVVVDGANRIHVLSGAAAAVAAMLDGSTVAALAIAAADRYGLPHERAVADVVEAVASMHRAGIVQLGDTDGRRSTRQAQDPAPRSSPRYLRTPPDQ